MVARWQDRYRALLKTPAEVVGLIPAGARVALHCGCAEPQTLVEALVAGVDRLRDVHLYALAIGSPALYCNPEFKGHLTVHALLCSGAMRAALASGQTDYLPANLSEAPRLFRERLTPLDVALIQVAPPDDAGYCSLGIGRDYTVQAVESARTVIAEVNRRMPRVGPDRGVPVERLSAVVESDRPLLEIPPARPGEAEGRIGAAIASLVPDGATVQIGIGAIPDAALQALGDRRDLGIHSGSFGDSVLDLLDSGAITGARKALNPGKVVGTTVAGTQRLYDAMDADPRFELYPSDYTHNSLTLARFERLVCINSALQVDLTGQVNAEALGPNQVSGVGGQMDFVRGAALSPGGVSIIALTAMAGGGKISRLVRRLADAPVTTPRAELEYVVTEYGVANLRGLSLRQRAEALIGIAHPDFRDELSASPVPPDP
jgi:4-hydroxybutyrate CoA-transferase